MKLHRLLSSLRIAKPLDEVFSFFADAHNLQKLTPEWLDFQVLTPKPVEMQVGKLIDYKLRIHGLPVRWRSEITVWEPPIRFVDKQRKGPYRAWIHEHRFRQQDGDTIVEDDVRYGVLGGALVNKLLVERDVRKIFQHRAICMRRIFDSESDTCDFVRIVP